MDYHLNVREFCGMVRKIFIYTREEVQKMNPRTLSTKGGESQLAAEGDAKEVKSQLLPFSSIPE